MCMQYNNGDYGARLVTLMRQIFGELLDNRSWRRFNFGKQL